MTMTTENCQNELAQVTLLLIATAKAARMPVDDVNNKWTLKALPLWIEGIMAALDELRASSGVMTTKLTKPMKAKKTAKPAKKKKGRR